MKKMDKLPNNNKNKASKKTITPKEVTTTVTNSNVMGSD
jgi:hypothetical protein